jgi:hypothetical protein
MLRSKFSLAFGPRCIQAVSYMADDNPRSADFEGGRRKNGDPADGTEPLIVTIEPQTKGKHSYEAKYYRLDRARLRLEKEAYRTARCTMIFLIIYTGLTLAVAAASIVSAYAAKRSADTATKVMHIDDRAWIMFIWDVPHPSDQDLLVVTSHMVNYGKTPAFKLRVVAAATLASINDMPEFDYSEGTGHPHVTSDGPIFQPRQADYSTEPFLIPVFVRHTATGQMVKFNDALNQKLRSRELVVYIHGRIDYDDIFGVRRWVTFCDIYPRIAVSTGPTPGIRACADHNATDTDH